MKFTATFERIARMDRPPEYLNELRECASLRLKDGLVLDSRSPCYEALQKKYATSLRERDHEHFKVGIPMADLPSDERAVVVGVLESEKKSEGLGDTLKKMIEGLGLDRAARLYEKLTDKRCQCDARRKFLNKWWPYKSAVAENGVAVVREVNPNTDEKNERAKDAEETRTP